MIQAEVIADSVSRATGRRLTTFLLVYPRYVHCELLTHRVFARNSASSRAIPVKTVLKNVWREPALPVRWGRTKKGMQDGGALPRSAAALCRQLWLMARYPAMATAWAMVKFGLHKQVANRLLEPWSHMTVVLTGTEWKNFYRLRYHPAAQPEFQALAQRMLEAHAAGRPRTLNPGDWHLPFSRDSDWLGRNDSPAEMERVLLARCTARCARASYVNFYGKDSEADDLRLHDDLMKNGHWSPFEHCCRAEAEDKFFGHTRGFTPYRKTFPRETWDDGAPFDPAALLADIAGART